MWSVTLQGVIQVVFDADILELVPNPGAPK